jgi:GTP-binding protein Era
MLDRPVHLFLHVKVDERWQDRREHYGDVGLDYDA